MSLKDGGRTTHGRLVDVSAWQWKGSKPHLKEYKDAFKISLPARYKLVKNTGSLDELFVHHFARSFFTCKIFTRLEKKVLLAARAANIIEFDREDDEVLKFKAFKFLAGDKVLVWRVIGRESNEILLGWEVGRLSGTTWLHIPQDENVLVLGSSFLLPREDSEQESVYSSAGRELQLGPGLPTLSPGRLQQALVRGLTALLLPLHLQYSKYLLVSTLNKILTEETTEYKGRPQGWQ